jgi:hypothetical protein
MMRSKSSPRYSTWFGKPQAQGQRGHAAAIQWECHAIIGTWQVDTENCTKVEAKFKAIEEASQLSPSLSKGLKKGIAKQIQQL